MSRESENRALLAWSFGLALTIVGLLKLLPALGLPWPVLLYLGITLVGLWLTWWGIKNVD